MAGNDVIMFPGMWTCCKSRSLSITNGREEEEEKGRERERRARLVNFAFRKRGSAFTFSILFGSPANMKESRRLSSWLVSFSERVVQKSPSPSPFPSSSFFLFNPFRLFADQERDSGQVHQGWHMHSPKGITLGCKHPPVTTPPDIQITAGKLWNYAFSAGNENIVTGNKIFWLLPVMELVWFLTGKQKFQRGSNRNRAGRVL